MKKTFTLLFLLTGGLLSSAQAQSVNYVTEIITTYGGLWRSGDGSTSAATGVVSAGLSTTKPDNSHDLLSFTIDGQRYSTGVNDALLISNNFSFSPGQYRALPTATLGAPTTNTKVGLGQLFDGVDNGPSNPAPASSLPSYLSDGVNGLDLGTCVANIPAGTVTFTITSVSGATINDNVPDILVTQVADPNGSTDSYRFLDANDKVVGNSVTVTFDNIPVVGSWVADFYEAAQTPRTLSAGFTKTPRDLRLWAADFSKFGITQSNYGTIRKFQITLSGNSDVAFVAYNTRAVTVLPVELTSFSAAPRPNGQVQLAWRTASELHADHFMVEASTDGRSFVPVGQVAAAGTKTSPTDYQFQHQPAATGVVYYRLHQLDKDGSGAYSPVVVVQVHTAEEGLQAYPNPFKQTLNLRLPAGVATGTVQLLAADGRTVYQHTLTAAERATPTCTLRDLPRLQPGIYLLRTVLDGQVTLQKLVKE